MKRLGFFLLAVAMVCMVGCGGGGGNSDSDDYDPTGSEWQFLVATADAGDTMYTLSFFDSSGAKAARGLFTAVSASGASYSGSWTSSGNVVTGASSGNFAFTLTVNDDTTTGTIDYVTAEGSGTAPAAQTGSTASACLQYIGNWSVTRASGVNATLTIKNDCSVAYSNMTGSVSGNTITASEAPRTCALSIEGTFTSSTAASGRMFPASPCYGEDTWTATKQ